MNLFDTNAQPHSVTSNNIFGAGAQGPFKLETVDGDESILLITAQGDNRKRIMIPADTPNIIPRDINGDAQIYITSVDDEKVLLETNYRNGVIIIINHD